MARLFEDQRQELALEMLTESLASKVDVTVSDIHRPGMALMGFIENFLPERLQILGQTESIYLSQLSEEDCLTNRRVSLMQKPRSLRQQKIDYDCEHEHEFADWPLQLT